MIINDLQKEKIFSLVRECGKVMLSAHDLENNAETISEKYGTANFVTVFDVKVQNMLISGLLDIVPGAHFIAEEKDNAEIDLSDGICFIIDPIDGTANFIHDLQASAVSVGFFYDGEPVFSLIFDPYRDEMFYASKGEGAFLNGRPIHVSSRNLDKAMTAFGTSPYNRDTLGDITFAIAKSLYMRTADLRRTGAAAIDLCNVACGRTDVFFEVILSPWDFAGGWLIISEAGGKLTDFNGKTPVFSKPSSVLCTNGSLHEEVLDILKTTEEEFYGR